MLISTMSVEDISRYCNGDKTNHNHPMIYCHLEGFTVVTRSRERYFHPYEMEEAFAFFRQATATYFRNYERLLNEGHIKVSEEDAATERLVRQALALDELHDGDDWGMDFSPKGALLFVSQAEIYNRMTRGGMVGLVNYINEHTPKLKDSSYSHRFRIGNECSRVIYVYFPTVDIPFGMQEWGHFFGQIEKFANSQAGCDELSVRPYDTQMELRMWWD